MDGVVTRMPNSMATDIAITKENGIHNLYIDIYIIHRRSILGYHTLIQ